MQVAEKRRILYLSTPLGPDKLVLNSFSGTEAFSRLFSYHLLMASHQEAIDPKDIVGKSVTWKVQYQSGPPRFFNGWVSQFAASGYSPRQLRLYRAEVVP